MQGVWSEKDTGEVFPGVEDKGLHALTGKFLGKRQRLTPLRESLLLCPALTCRIFFEMNKKKYFISEQSMFENSIRNYEIPQETLKSFVNRFLKMNDDVDPDEEMTNYFDRNGINENIQGFLFCLFYDGLFDVLNELETKGKFQVLGEEHVFGIGTTEVLAEDARRKGCSSNP